MKKIMLDTNFLMLPYQHNIDIFAEIDRLVDEKYRLMTFDGVIRELRDIEKGGGKDALAARVVLKLVDDTDISIVGGSNDVDGDIMDFSLKGDTIVCTNDKVLKKDLTRKGVGVIFMRGGDHLERI